MADEVKSILYSDAIISAIQYAATNEVAVDYMLREGAGYTDLFIILDNGTTVEDLDLDDISKRLLIKPRSSADLGLRVLFAYVTLRIDAEPDINFSELVDSAYEQYAELLNIANYVRTADQYKQLYNAQLEQFQSASQMSVFNSIDTTFNMLLNGYREEWRQRLLSMDEPSEEEAADYYNKFGQEYEAAVDSTVPYYSYLDRLPQVSPPRYSRAIYTTTASIVDSTGQTGEVLDGYQLFNSTEVSEQIPMILYTRNDKEKYYKILDGFVVTDLINSMFIRPFENVAEVLQRGPLRVERSGGRGKTRIVEEVTSEYNDANTMQYIYKYGSNYVNVILYLETRTVNVNVYSGQLEGLTTIAGIDVAGLSPTNIEGKFDIYGSHIPPFILEDVITNNREISMMFDMIETNSINAVHVNPSYVYSYPTAQNLEDLNLTESMKVIPIRFHVENSYVTGPEYDTAGNQIDVGTAKVTIHFNSIVDAVTLERFSTFMRLFTAYLSNVQYDLFDEYYMVTDVSYPEYTKVSTLETRDILKSRRPDIFIDGYATICQSDKQPQIISEEEYSTVDTRRTLRFPRATLGEVEDQIILYCADSKSPYPTLRRNTLPNAEQFPVLPCCQANNTTSRRDTISYYEQFGEYAKGSSNIRDRMSILHTLQILSPGAASEVLRSNVPSLYKALGFTGGTAVKVGVVQNNDSFLNACAYLLGDSELNRDVILADPWNAALLAQECYDDPDPRETLRNEGTVFDDRYYRIIEVMYNITVYVMQHKNNNIEFKLPRHIPPYVRNYSNTGCILILETMERGIPRYEPLVYRTIVTDGNGRESIRDVSILDEAANRAIFNDYYMRTVGTMSGDKPYVPLNLPIEGATGQLIDRDGKMRGITYADKGGFSVITDPAQPLDLPTVTIDDLQSVSSLQDIQDRFPNSTIDFYGRYQGIGLNGVWYRVGDIDCFTLVDEAARELDDVPVITRSVPYIDVTADYDWFNFVYSYPTQRASLNVILDFIYHVYYYNGRTDDLFYVDDNGADDYIIDKIPHEINRPLTLEEAAQLSNVVRLIDDQYYIYLYSDKFAEGVLYHVHRLLKTNVVPVTVLAIPPLNYAEDSTIYSGDAAYTTWLDLTQYELKQYDAVPYSYTSIYPYIYTKGSMYFIVQPVNPKDSQGELKATYVASVWRKTRINHGYNPQVDNIYDIELGARTEVINAQISNVYADYFYHENRIYAILPFEDLDETVIMENRRAEEYRIFEGQSSIETTTQIIRKTTKPAKTVRVSEGGTTGGRVIKGKRDRGRPRGRKSKASS